MHRNNNYQSLALLCDFSSFSAKLASVCEIGDRAIKMHVFNCCKDGDVL